MPSGEVLQIFERHNTIITLIFQEIGKVGTPPIMRPA